jgi:hypothetical protein
LGDRVTTKGAHHRQEGPAGQAPFNQKSKPSNTRPSTR